MSLRPREYYHLLGTGCLVSWCQRKPFDKVFKDLWPLELWWYSFFRGIYIYWKFRNHSDNLTLLLITISFYFPRGLVLMDWLHQHYHHNHRSHHLLLFPKRSCAHRWPVSLDKLTAPMVHYGPLADPSPKVIFPSSSSSSSPLST